MSIKYNDKIEINPETCEVFYEGELVDDQYGHDISEAFAIADLIKLFHEEFNVSANIAYSFALKVRELEKQCRLPKADLVFKVYMDSCLYETL